MFLSVDDSESVAAYRTEEMAQKHLDYLRGIPGNTGSWYGYDMHEVELFDEYKAMRSAVKKHNANFN